MNILWITNILFPEAQSLLSGESAFKSSGGWLLGAAENIVKCDNVKLTVCSVSNQVKTLTRLHGEKIDYYILPYGKGNLKVNHEYEPLWKIIHDAVIPDIVHIHGTEFSHGLAYVNACGEKNVCVSIQGMVSVIADYYQSGLKSWDIIRNCSISNLFGLGVFSSKKRCKSRGEAEVQLLRRVNFVIGRTEWSRAHVWSINNKATFYYGGETLRSEFYGSRKWRYDSCVPHSIFISQAYSPIKGLHIVLKAIPLIRACYPDVKLTIAGSDITKSASLRDHLKITDYGKIIKKIIIKNKLTNIVSFTGPLSGERMCEEYLKSNVFICASSIENSPNSIGEAQLLGVPVISSFVGGIMDMMGGRIDSLYRFEDYVTLAFKVCSIFEQAGYIDTDYLIKEAGKRHDPERNTHELLQIYSNIMQ